MLKMGYANNVNILVQLVLVIFIVIHVVMIFKIDMVNLLVNAKNNFLIIIINVLLVHFLVQSVKVKAVLIVLNVKMVLI